MTTAEDPAMTNAMSKKNSIIACARDGDGDQDNNIIMDYQECEWVDDAVLNLSAAFSTLCHTSQCLDYVDQQIQYEHLLMLVSDKNSSDDVYESVRGLVDTTANPGKQHRPCSLVDNSFLDDLGLEVETGGILCHHKR